MIQCSVNQYLGTVRYCKVSIYHPNIDIVLFYGKYTNIDIDAQYQEIYTDILVLSVFFSIIMKTFKHIFLLFIQMLKDAFFLCLSLKKDNTMLIIFIVVFDLYWKGMAWHACLLVVVDYYHNIQKCHFLW